MKHIILIRKAQMENEGTETYRDVVRYARRHVGFLTMLETMNPHRLFPEVTITTKLANKFIHKLA